MLDRLFAVTWPLNYRKVIIMRFLSIVTVLTLITLDYNYIAIYR